jgi:hypothetical protein
MDSTDSMPLLVRGFYETLIQTLPPRTVSDRTCYRHLCRWLSKGIDQGHVNGDRRDNRAANLQALDGSTHHWVEPRNHTGVWRGVNRKSQLRGRWLAELQWDGVKHLLYSFTSPLLVAFARDDLARHVTGLSVGLNFSKSIGPGEVRQCLIDHQLEEANTAFVRRTDGSVRWMRCRIELGPAGGLKFNPRRRALVSVVDLDASGHRFIPSENVLCLIFSSEKIRVARRALAFFRHTPRTEEAFYLRFQALPDERLEALRRWWARRDDWTIFPRVCRFWGVGYRRHMTAAENPPELR